jgi:hypothetical protein
VCVNHTPRPTRMRRSASSPADAVIDPEADTTHSASPHCLRSHWTSKDRRTALAAAAPDTPKRARDCRDLPDCTTEAVLPGSNPVFFSSRIYPLPGRPLTKDGAE